MTYASLALVFLVPAVVVAVTASVRRRLGGRWWAVTGVTIAVLLVLTVVFDSVMIGADLFRFDDDALLGVRLGLAPLEDLAWPLAAALLVPALWELLPPRATPAAPGAPAVESATSVRVRHTHRADSSGSGGVDAGGAGGGRQ